MQEKKVSFKSSRNLIVIMNVLASILFFLSYFFLKNIWLLIGAIILIVGAIIAFFVINFLGKKLLSPKKNNGL